MNAVSFICKDLLYNFIAANNNLTMCIILPNNFYYFNAFIAQETLYELIHFVSYNAADKIIIKSYNKIKDKLLLQTALFSLQLTMYLLYELWKTQLESPELDNIIFNLALNRSAKAYASVATDLLGIENRKAAYINLLIKVSPKIYHGIKNDNINVEKIFLKYLVEYYNGLNPLPNQEGFTKYIFFKEITASLICTMVAGLYDFYQEMIDSMDNEYISLCDDINSNNIFQLCNKFNGRIARDYTLTDDYYTYYIS